MGPNDYLTALKSALREYRFRDVRTLTDQIDPVAFELPQIKKTLGMIRRKRLFPELEHAASLFHMAGKTAPVIQRQWSQSLLDQGRVPQALTILESMSQDSAADPVEGPEVRGLIGRAHKQGYINDHNAEDLKSAISAYLPDWECRQGDYRWHGINVVALLARAQRDGVDPGQALDPTEMAKGILEDIEERGASGIWDYATALEASVALDDDDAALAWTKKYVQHPDTDAFELASTLRQLKEVWLLEETPLGAKLLPVLEYALLQQEGGTVQPARFDQVPDRTGFEAVWGPEGYVRLQWMETLLGCCTAVARVSDAKSGDPWGTGFLVPGSCLNPDWEAAPVFVTNAHVISSDPADGAPLCPARARVEFTRLPGRPTVGLGELRFHSSPLKLDVSILRIDPPSGLHAFVPCPDLPDVSADPDKPQRVYVIGHPEGAELVVSLYDNSLIEYENPYVRYRSPTEGGHSGSPVLTRKLDVFAVHHRALYERQLNEGITLNAVKNALHG
jgi:hypothetical protein